MWPFRKKSEKKSSIVTRIAKGAATFCFTKYILKPAASGAMSGFKKGLKENEMRAKEEEKKKQAKKESPKRETVKKTDEGAEIEKKE